MEAPSTVTISPRSWRNAHALLLAASVSVPFVGIGEEARAAGEGRWQIAPAGPCAEAPTRSPCAGGACVSDAPARSRFDPIDVAAAGGGAGGPPPPQAEPFRGPGSCADAGTPCGDGPLIAASEMPPIPSPGDESGGPGVIEPPVTPGELPGGGPGGGLPGGPGVIEPPATPGDLPGRP